MDARLIGTLLVAVGLPISFFMAIRGGIPAVWVGVVDYTLAVMVMSAGFLETQHEKFRRRFLSVATLAMLVLVALLAWRPQWVSLAPPIAIYAGLSGFFLRSLRPGSEPLIARFARMERGGQLPDLLAVYARRLTWAWVLFLAALMVESAILAFSQSIETYLLFTNTYNYVLLGGFVVGEYIYRRLRFRQFNHVSPWAFLKLVLKANPLKSGRHP